MSVRPEREIPDTSHKIDKGQLDADVAHENNIRYYLDNTELGVVDEEQQAIEALVRSYRKLHLHLDATDTFFKEQRSLSSGVKGIGRVQAKEIITAGAFPMSLLFPQQQGGFMNFVKSILGKGDNQQTQQGSTK